MPDDKLSLSRSFLWILLITLSVSGSAYMGWLYYLHARDRRLNDEQYRVVAIVQSTSRTEALKTVYLAEILELSLDKPINLYRFNVKEAERKLLSCPQMKRASVKKLLPGTLYISYEMRSPVAYLGDYSNTALDEEGYLFPISPFFTPKHLPTIYLGLDKKMAKWGICLKEHPSMQLASVILEVFEGLQLNNLVITQLDVSQSQADSYGQRQVVAILEENNPSWVHPIENKKLFLRLNPEHYMQNLVNFQTLLASRDMLKHKTIIDLRIPHLAFIKQDH